MYPNVEPARGADADFGARLTALIPIMRIFARRLCRGRDGAEDLAQESMLNAWKSRASFTPGGNLEAWLFAIQRNAFHSAHRRRWREVAWDDAMGAKLIAAPTQHASAELADVARAMSHLPDEQREALILVGAGGFTYCEAAALRGCATGTMKSRVSRARIAVATFMTADVAFPSPREAAVDAYRDIARDVAALPLARSRPDRRARRRESE